MKLNKKVHIRQTGPGKGKPRNNPTKSLERQREEANFEYLHAVNAYRTEQKRQQTPISYHPHIKRTLTIDDIHRLKALKQRLMNATRTLKKLYKE